MVEVIYVFVRFQGIKRNAEGVITAGTGSLMRSVYDPAVKNAGHSRQEVIELLGRVMWTDREKGRVGRAIFASPLRGLVEYDQDAGKFWEVDAADPRLVGTDIENADRSHAELGPVWVFLLLLARTPMLSVFRRAFGPLYQRVLAHVAHTILAPDDARGCGSWFDSSALSWAMPELESRGLDCDTAYFREMGDDAVKVAFFGVLVQEMRKVDPDFGRRCCYIDTMPLPGGAKDNPLRALLGRGTDGASVQSRLALVLDVPTGIPVWYAVVSAEALDHAAAELVRREVEETLDIQVDELDLDAGYACPELFAALGRDNVSFAGDEGAVRQRTVLVRVPRLAHRPSDELYLEAKPHFFDEDYLFDHDGYSFFGMRFERELFDQPAYVHVLLDHGRALELGRRWREEHADEFAALPLAEREWYRVRDGLFVLAGNADETPAEALAQYRDRAKIEARFKEAKAYLKALPCDEWSREAVLGKVLNDVVECMLYRELRMQMKDVTEPVDKVLADLRGLECARLSDDIVAVLTPKQHIRDALFVLKITLPGHMDLAELRALALEGVEPNPVPLAARKSRAGRKPEQARRSV